MELDLPEPLNRATKDVVVALRYPNEAFVLTCQGDKPEHLGVGRGVGAFDKSTAHAHRTLDDLDAVPRTEKAAGSAIQCAARSGLEQLKRRQHDAFTQDLSVRSDLDV